MFFNTQPSGNTWFTPVHRLLNINGSVVHVHLHRLTFYMDIQGTIYIMNQFKHTC